MIKEVPPRIKIPDQSRESYQEASLKGPVETEARAFLGSRLVHHLTHSGKAISGPVRREMEQLFDRDFSQIQLHTDSISATSATELGARAYTTGGHIVFAPGEYNPHSTLGRRLIEHELSHVVQQSVQPPKRESPRVSQPRSGWEGGLSMPRGRAPIPEGLTPIVMRQHDPKHTRGHAGEQRLGFGSYRFENGWIFVEGPSGRSGHHVTERGVDGIAYNVRTQELHILDNKSLKRAGNVGSATAIDPKRNLLNNLSRLINRIDGTSQDDLPYRQRILRLLRQTRARLRKGEAIPASGRVRVIVTNAGGRSKGITRRLKRLGVEFIDIQRSSIRPGTAQAAGELRRGHPEAPRPGSKRPSLGRPPSASRGGGGKSFGKGSRKSGGSSSSVARSRSRVRTRDFQTRGHPIYPQRSRPRSTVGSPGQSRFRPRGAGLAQVLPEAMSALQDLSIRHAVATRMLGQWSTVERWRRNHPNDVILAAVALQEWEQPDAAGQVGRAVLYVKFFHGPTREDAERELSNSVLPSPPRGWRIVGPFRAVIEPSRDLSEVKSLVEDQEACFIATACMGTRDACEVRILRAFRDRILRGNSLGRSFISMYYRFGRYPAGALSDNRKARSIVRALIVRPAATLAATLLILSEGRGRS